MPLSVLIALGALGYVLWSQGLPPFGGRSDQGAPSDPAAGYGGGDGGEGAGGDFAGGGYGGPPIPSGPPAGGPVPASSMRQTPTITQNPDGSVTVQKPVNVFNPNQAPLSPLLATASAAPGAAVSTHGMKKGVSGRDQAAQAASAAPIAPSQQTVSTIATRLQTGFVNPFQGKFGTTAVHGDEE